MWEAVGMAAVMFTCSCVFTNLHYGMGWAGILVSLGIGCSTGVVAYHRAGENKKSLLRWQPVALLAGAAALVGAGLYIHLS